MARIRTIKPEFFTSDSLSRVSLTAERTFCGLFSLVDDRGRFRDDARIIYGRLWVTRTEQTQDGVEEDLRQLAEEGLICRYTGCDGKKYLHPVKWLAHQKISNRTESRAAACPEHQAELECGGCKRERCPAPAPENFRRTAETLPVPRQAPADPAQHPSPAPVIDQRADTVAATSEADKSTGQRLSQEVLRTTAEPLGTGSRIQDPGSTPNGGGAAAPGATARLIIEYKRQFDQAPPRSELDRLGKEIKALVAEGFAEEQILAGLREFARLPGMGPTLLPSLVHAAATGRLAGQRGPGSPGRHQGWTNPDADAYAEEL
ncbi:MULTISPECIES: hypothetical protein [unclassified Kitasatospora]|uniref:hypothetical protein n=1 Tax=unclassified Kitasatospora TaxID=2633591 RepID=UPI00070A0825|nr:MULTISPECIES: hypothetical protein [unclassified Kitasatospora]KQV20893.1 hypothetical protein ASC99_20525 [Kitasatospora sp. Root107]KRB60453.1 hypothetical protein ASE03_12655 [Kitasatospora sp. Root187]